MNLKVMMNKLLFALQREGMIYKINTFRFYSEKSNKYMTNYKILLEVEIHDEEENDNPQKEVKKKFVEVLNTYSQVEIVKMLAEDLKNVREEKRQEMKE